MEENQTQLTKASEYIKKYGLKKKYNEFTGETNYQRELHFADKNVQIILFQHELEETECYIMKQAFYKNKYDKKWGCYGVFGKPKFINGIINNIKEFEAGNETSRNI